MAVNLAVSEKEVKIVHQPNELSVILMSALC